MKQEIYIKSMIIIALFFLLISCSNENMDKIESIAIPVEIEVAQKKTFSNLLNYTGILQPIQEMKLMSDIPGKVKKLYVDEGTKVKKGQLLAEMDTETIKLRLAQTKAGVSVAEAQYNSAKRDLDRFTTLRNKEAVSEQQAEKITLAYEAAQAQLEQAQAALNIAFCESV